MTDHKATTAIAFVVLVLAIMATTVNRLEASPPRRGTVAYCKAHSAGLVERKCIIRVIFGARHGRDAVRVAWCESRIDPSARNGQYRGILQMGSAERARYGHGSTVEAQARAARRYFVASGSDWSPWSCKP